MKFGWTRPWQLVGWALLLRGLVGCQPDPDGDRPELADCEWGRYWADCGGAGAPRVGCDVEIGECRWFVGGTVARGYVASECPSTGVCCESVPNGTGRWPFADWMPEGAVLEQAADVDLLLQGVLTSTMPEGMPVTLDFTDPAPSEVQVTCEGSFSGNECALRLVERRRSGASLVLHFRQDDLDIARRSYVLEVWEAPAGLQGRWYQIDRPQTDAPRAPYCGRSDQRVTSIRGEIHLSPDAFEHPDDAHGSISAAYPEGLEFTIRF